MLVSFSFYAQEWKDVGPFSFIPDATEAEFTILSNGKPIVAYKEGASTQIQVQYWNGYSWNFYPQPTTNSVQDIRITSVGDEFYVGFFDLLYSEYQVHKYVAGSGWTQIGFLSSLLYDPGRIDLDATEMTIDDLHLVSFNSGTGNAEHRQWDGGNWNVMGSDFLTTPPTIVGANFDLEDNNINNHLLSYEFESIPDLRYYFWNGGSWENYPYLGNPFIVTDPLCWGMDVTVGQKPWIAYVETGVEDSVRLVYADEGTGTIQPSKSLYVGPDLITEAKGMSVTVTIDNDVIVVFDTPGAAFETKAFIFDGADWLEMGAGTLPETDLRDVFIDVSSNSFKPYILYRTPGSLWGMKTLNHLPTLTSSSGAIDICEDAADVTVISSLIFNDVDHDSLYLSITSSDPAVIADGDITWTPLTTYSPYASSNEFEITVTPTGSGTTTLTIEVHDGVDFETHTETITVNPLPSFSVAKTDVTTCSGTDGTLTFSGLIASHDYSIQFDIDGSPFSAGTITTDGAGNYTVPDLSPGTYDNFSVTNIATGCIGALATVYTISEPTYAGPSYSSYLNPTTCSGTDGSITFTGFYAATAYTITYDKDGTGDSFSTTSDGLGEITLTGITAGTYDNFTFTNDATLCSGSDASVVTLTDPAGPTPSYFSLANTTTCGGVDGSLIFSGLDASTSYDIDFLKDGLADSFSGTSDLSGQITITGLSAATYTSFTFTDPATTCTGSLTGPYVIADPTSPAPVFSLSSNTLTCGGSEGVIEFNGLAPSTAYTADFLKDGLSDSFSGTTDATGVLSITGLSAAIYSAFTITNDATTCSGSAAGSYTISDPAAPTPAYASASDATTCGGSDGSLVFTGLSPSTAYTVDYLKDGIGDTFSGSSDALGQLSITGLGAANYTSFTFTNDATTCSGSLTGPYEVLNPAAPIIATVVGTNPTTCGASDGYITVGGLTPGTVYNVYYDAGSTVSAGSISTDGLGELIITGLSSGTYDSVAVEDLTTGCIGYEAVVTVVTLSDPSAPTFTVSLETEPSTCVSADGSIKITGLIGGLAYDVDYDKDGVPVATLTGLPADASGEIFLTGLAPGLYDGFTVIDGSGCTGSDGTAITLTGPTAPSVGAGADVFVCENEEVILVADNPDGAIITWDTGYPDGFVLDLLPGVYTYTVTAELSGCSSSDAVTVTVHEQPSISIATTLATCGLADGTVDASITGGTAPYTIYWSNGASTEDITDLEPSIYYMNVTDANDCYSMAPATIELLTLTLGGAETMVSCPKGSDGAIDLSVGGTGPFTYYWSNGETTEDISGLTAGQYEVFVTDDAGCMATNTFTITEPEEFTGFMTPTLATCGAADGGILANVFGGTGTYSYAWTDEFGVTVGADASTLTGIEAGAYNVTVTDDNGCSAEFHGTISNIGAPSILIESITAASCIDDGAIDISAVSTTSTISSFAWSTGEATEDASSKPAGYYSVEVMDAAGCMAAKGMEIPAVKPDAPAICIVTVDTTTNTNRVVWEKPVSTTIDYYEIYRESAVAGLFQLVNTQDYDEESFFTDSVAYPQLRSWRYRMVAVNNCGVASNMGLVHKTIHIVFHESSPGNYQLNWDAYEGFAYSEYSIYRFTLAAGWELITTQSSALPPTYTDTPPTTEGLNYMIEIVPPSTCTSILKATDHNSSRSNTSHVFNPDGENDLSISEAQKNVFTIYPNPSTDIFYLQFNEPESIQLVNVYDLSGNLVYSNQEISNGILSLDVSLFESSMYLVEVITSTGTYYKKALKQ